MKRPLHLLDAFFAKHQHNASPADWKELFEQADNLWDELFDLKHDIDQLLQHRAQFYAQILQHIWNKHQLNKHQHALIAVGGFGRLELHPGSDIDVLILLREEETDKDAQRLSDFLTELWDLSLDVGHSVRTVNECVEEARNDLTIMTNLMETHFICGEHTLYEQLNNAITPGQIWPAKEFLYGKIDEQKKRYERFNNTAYRVEPNLKDGPGGLRDIHTIEWITQRLNDEQLLPEKFLTDKECVELTEGKKFLSNVRWALHRIAQRKEDRLLFDHQRAVANKMGYTHEEINLAIEEFMQSYYRIIMRLERLNDILLQYFGDLVTPHSDDSSKQTKSPRFISLNNYLDVIDPQIFVRNPSALLEAFVVFQQDQQLLGFTARCIRSIRSHIHLIDLRFRQNPKNRDLFMQLFYHGKGLTHTLRHMNRYGVLAAYIPAFGKIVGRMQYDLFHAYTVDEHTLNVIRNMRRVSVDSYRDEIPHASEIFDQLPKPALLYLAGLFHDIAKGRGGDHSALGAEDAMTFCLEHGLNKTDAKLVSWLVQQHLFMSATAQRKDINDPEIIHEFATKIRSQKNLDYLYLLTIADMRGTNPELWNSWKASLLQELYESTSRALKRGLNDPLVAAELAEETRDEAKHLLTKDGLNENITEALWKNFNEDYFLRNHPEEIAWHTKAIHEHGDDLPVILTRDHHRGGTDLFVYHHDMKGLFAHITDVITQKNLSIVDARILSTDDHKILDSFLLLDQSGQAIDDEWRIASLIDSLHERLSTPTDSLKSIHLGLPRRLKHFDVDTEISFQPQTEDKPWTIMELKTLDHPGLLSKVACMLAKHDVTVHNARVSTIGELTDDVFFITDEDDHPIVKTEQQNQIRDWVLSAIEDDHTQTKQLETCD